jgi:erythrocyte band 7 integral membrane protein
VDTRINVIDLERQIVLTKDNITISIDACVYYTITDPHYAIYRLRDVKKSVSQLTYATLKNTAGVFTFQELLEKRNDIANDIEKQVEPTTKSWGIQVNEIYFKGMDPIVL